MARARSGFAWRVGGAALALLAGLSWKASAHVGVGFLPVGGFAAGLEHPVSGIDHLLAMIAVGLWAAQQRGRALWAIPLAFVGVMSLGGALGMAGVALPFAERGILVSLLVLGVLVAASIRLPLVAGMLMMGAFAVFHGHAHGTEMPASAAGASYGAGFALTTAFLHASGIGLAYGVRRLAPLRGSRMIRLAGVTVAIAGIWLWVV